jgi:hypothetical protein
MVALCMFVCACGFVRVCVCTCVRVCVSACICMVCAVLVELALGQRFVHRSCSGLRVAAIIAPPPSSLPSPSCSCSGRGTCSPSGACVCNADYKGAHCETPVSCPTKLDRAGACCASGVVSNQGETGSALVDCVMLGVVEIRMGVCVCGWPCLRPHDAGGIFSLGFHSISFTGGMGVPKYKIGLRGGGVEGGVTWTPGWE